MNNKIFIAFSVMLALLASLFSGVGAPAEVPDSVTMGNIAPTAAPEKPASKEDIFAVIASVTDEWRGGVISAEMAIAQLDEFKNHADADIRQAASEAIALIAVETDAKILFDAAKKQYLSGDYMAAIESIISTSPAWSGWDKCSDMLISCRKKMLEKVGEPSTAAEYESAIATLDEYLSLVDDESAEQIRDDFTQALARLRDIENIISDALTLYDEGNYAAAFASLSAGLEKYPGTDELDEAYQLCRLTYIDDVTEEASALREKRQYDQAIAVLDEAIEICSCNEFAALREEIREDSSFLYRFKKGFRRRFGRLF